MFGKPIFSYITRDGREKSFNKKKIEKVLEKAGKGKYLIDDEIELVYIKNVTFDKNVVFSFEGNDDTIIIFDNCAFRDNELIFNGGNIDIIDPVCLKASNLKIVTYDVGDFNVIFNDNNSKYSNVTIYYNLNAKNVTIDGGNPIFQRVNVENAIFRNIRNMRSLDSREIKNLSIINCNINGSVWVDVAEMISLENVFIDAGFGYIIDIKSPVIRAKNVIISSGEFIKINEDIYYPYDYKVMLTDKDFSQDGLMCNRREFISVLKGYRDLVEDNLVKRKKELLIDYSRKIEKCEVNLANLKKEERVVAKKLEKKLREKPCSKYVD